MQNHRNTPGFAAIEAHDELWLCCLQYAQRQTADELQAMRMALDYYRTNVGVAVKTSPSAVRSMQRQAEGLRRVLQRDREEVGL